MDNLMAIRVSGLFRADVAALGFVRVIVVDPISRRAAVQTALIMEALGAARGQAHRLQPRCLRPVRRRAR